MSNANEPAAPWTYYDRSDSGDVVPRDQFCGLTKRELIAAMAMQGHLSMADFGGYSGIDEMIEASVNCADALLKRLKETEGE